MSNFIRSINMDGPAGNAVSLMATAKHMAKNHGENGNKIVREMRETGDYDMLVQTLLFYFGDYIRLVNSHNEDITSNYIGETVDGQS